MSHQRRFILFSLFVLVVAISALATSSVTAAPLIHVNFQQGSFATPAGYTADTGLPFGAKGAFTFGWVTEATLGNPTPTPIDTSSSTRTRATSGETADPRLLSYTHTRRGDCCTTGVIDPVAWEILVPNGVYDVTVGAGDDQGGSTHTINVEGVNVLNIVSGPGNRYGVNTVQVTVTDGKLTMDSIGGDNTKVGFIDIDTPALPDGDGDGVPDASDNCPTVANPSQANNYGGAAGDACEDSDGDSFMDDVDGCPTQAGVAPNGCPLADGDGDGVADNVDNCPAVANPTQANNYGGPAGDACDDTDSDFFVDAVDACPLQAGIGSSDGCPVAGGGDFYEAPDDRLNWGNSGLQAAVYRRPGDYFGNPQIHIYCINEQGEGYFGMAISEADIAGYAANPTSNTLVKSSGACNLSFYILTSGEFQINIGPSSDGKVTAMVFETLFALNAHFYDFIDFGGGAPGTPAQPTGNTTAGVTPLSGCRVTTLDMLNFRDAPSLDSVVKTMVPFDLTLDAINKSGDWFNVIFEDDNGWVHGDFLNTSGPC